MHVTFGVETALAGTYESLLHHALEVAAVQHPLLLGLRRPQVRENRTTSTFEVRGARAVRGTPLPCLTLTLTLTLTPACATSGAFSDAALRVVHVELYVFSSVCFVAACPAHARASCSFIILAASSGAAICVVGRFILTASVDQLFFSFVSSFFSSLSVCSPPILRLMPSAFARPRGHPSRCAHPFREGSSAPARKRGGQRTMPARAMPASAKKPECPGCPCCTSGCTKSPRERSFYESESVVAAPTSGGRSGLPGGGLLGVRPAPRNLGTELAKRAAFVCVPGDVRTGFR